MPSARKASILCFSHDSSLMKTRVWLLQRAHYDVEGVMTETEFRQRLCAGPVDLIILCQTLPEVECAAAAVFAGEHCPGCRCLVMYTDAPACQPETQHALLNIHEGPAQFLSTVARMLPASAALIVPEP